VTVVRRVDQKIEGRIWPRIDSEAGGRYVGIPLHRRERGFTTVQGTGCGTVERSTVAIPAPHVILHANEDHGTEVHEN
jgi:hypothetical protein